MLNDILVAESDTVTIKTEEYRALVERKAYLDVIMAFAADHKTYVLSDISCVIKGLVEHKAASNKEVASDENLADEESESKDNDTQGEDSYA